MVCFLGMGCRGTVSLAPATLPWKKSLGSLCASLQSRQCNGEHEKVKGDEARINGAKTGPMESKPFVNSQRKLRKSRWPPGGQSGPVCPAGLIHSKRILCGAQSEEIASAANRRQNKGLWCSDVLVNSTCRPRAAVVRA